MKCFSAAACVCDDCPSIQFDIYEQKFDTGIAEDIGLTRIDCKTCGHNTGKCEDCLFFNDPRVCPKCKN